MEYLDTTFCLLTTLFTTALATPVEITPVCVPFGDATGQTSFQLQQLRGIPFFGQRIKAYMQYDEGGVVLQDWDHPSDINELFAYKQNYTTSQRYFRELSISESEDIQEIAGISAKIQSSEVSRSVLTNVKFSATYAAIWSWRMNIDNQVREFQVILTTDGSLSFILYNYCNGSYIHSSQTTALILSNKPMVIFKRFIGEAPQRQYIFRVDQIACHQHNDYYCIKDKVRKFNVSSIKNRAAIFTFEDLTTLKDEPFYSSFNVQYRVTCQSEFDDSVVNGVTYGTDEYNYVVVEGLSPYTQYKCTLNKEIPSLNFTGENMDTIAIKTHADTPDSSPTNLKLVEISNDSAVISFDEVPLKLANGEIAYSANLTAVTSPVYSQSYIFSGSPIKLTGLKANTLHLVYVTAFTSVGMGPKSAIFRFTTHANPAYIPVTGKSTSVPPNTSSSRSSLNPQATSTYATTESATTTPETSTSTWRIIQETSVSTQISPTESTKGTTNGISSRSTPTEEVPVTSTTTEKPTKTEASKDKSSKPLIESTPGDDKYMESGNLMEITDYLTISIGFIYLLTIIVLVIVVLIFCIHRYKSRHGQYDTEKAREKYLKNQRLN